MALPENSAFTAVVNDPFFGKITRIDPEQARAWKKLGLEFCSNNGWDFKGNAYLMEEFEYLDHLEIELEELGINGRDCVTFHDGYCTNCFGFPYDPSWGECTISDEEFEIVGKFLGELGIQWCGNFDGPFFFLLASEQQILFLIEKLKPFTKNQAG